MNTQNIQPVHPGEPIRADIINTIARGVIAGEIAPGGTLQIAQTNNGVSIALPRAKILPKPLELVKKKEVEWCQWEIKQGKTSGTITVGAGMVNWGARVVIHWPSGAINPVKTQSQTITLPTLSGGVTEAVYFVVWRTEKYATAGPYDFVGDAGGVEAVKSEDFANKIGPSSTWTHYTVLGVVRRKIENGNDTITIEQWQRDEITVLTYRRVLPNESQQYASNALLFREIIWLGWDNLSDSPKFYKTYALCTQREESGTDGFLRHYSQHFLQDGETVQ